MKKDYSEKRNISYLNINGLQISESMSGYTHSLKLLNSQKNAEKMVTKSIVGIDYEHDYFLGHIQMVTKRYGISNESFGEMEKTSQMSVW